MNYLSRFFDHCRHFSVGYAITETRCMIDRKMMLRRGKPVSRKPELAKERYLLPFLTEFYADIIEQYQNAESKPIADSQAPIWVCWLQGESQAPKMVKALIANIRKQSGAHPVHIITESNFADYIALPNSYLAKYRQGIITAQQFTDLVRCELLADYGGLWVDATGFITRPIPNEAFDSPIYNVKNISPDFRHRNVVIDSTLWMSYLLGGHRGCVTYAFMRDCLIKYWKHYNTCVDYFLVYYIAKIARDNVPACKQEFESVPSNNYLCEMLSDAMEQDQPYVPGEERSFLDSDTWFYKLSWRTPYPLEAKNGQPTLAHIVIDTIMED